MCLKSCAYGSNILLLFAKESSNHEVLRWPPKLNLAESKVVAMLVSTERKVLQKEELKGIGMTSSDGMRVISSLDMDRQWKAQGLQIANLIIKIGTTFKLNVMQGQGIS